MGLLSETRQIQITFTNLSQSLPLLRRQISESAVNRVSVMNMVIIRGVLWRCFTWRLVLPRCASLSEDTEPVKPEPD